MKFDVVIGNPPYNSGMDLDFVNMGFDLCKQYCVMITPAKWQTAADDYSGCASKNINYKGFREKLVPHMSKVVFYPDALDLFGISQVDGITYYILDRGIHASCTVVNYSIHNKTFNGVENRSIISRETLYNNGNKIIKALGNYEKFLPEKVDLSKKYKVQINSQFVCSGVGSDERKKPESIGTKSNIFNSMGGVVAVAEPKIVEHIKEGAYCCAFSSDDKEECDNFISWINLKLVRFLLVCNISKLNGIYTNDYFRFVPAPPSGKFDHIYTDQELYQAFNLPQEYIDVIEAVIKERK